MLITYIKLIFKNKLIFFKQIVTYLHIFVQCGFDKQTNQKYYTKKAEKVAKNCTLPTVINYRIRC